MRTRRGMRCVLSILLVAALCAAGGHLSADDAKTQAAPSPGKADSPADAAKNPQNAFSEKECADWGAALEEAISEGDFDKYERLVDWDAMLQSAAIPLEPALQTYRESFISAVKKSIRTREGMVRALMDESSRGGTYKFLRPRRVGDETRLLFRVIGPEDSAGLNFHEYPVVRRDDGTIHAVDFLGFMNGYRLTEDFRLRYLAGAESVSAGVVERVLGRRDNRVAFFAAAQRAEAAFEAGKHRQVLKELDQLPDAARNHRPLLLLRHDAAGQVGKKEHDEALAEYEKLFPDDPAIDLHAIDPLLERQEFDQAVRRIDRIEKTIGGDSFLKVLRGQIYLQQEKWDAARNEGAKAVALEPTLFEGYSLQISVSLQANDHKETASLLKQIDSRFEVDVDVLARDPAFAEFVKSPEYAAWKKERSSSP